MTAVRRIIVGSLDHLCPEWLRSGSTTTRAAKRRRWDCQRCRDPLAYIYLEGEASIEIKCPRCGTYNLLPPPD
jgi:LSD1 subclass zinc finger protein